MTKRLPKILSKFIKDDRADYDLIIEPDLMWFRGHFPDCPILPGIVQLDWALHLARDANLPAPRSAQDFQVKYRAMVLPCMTVRLSIIANENRGLFSFEYRNADQKFSSGTAHLAPRGIRHE